MPSKKIVCLGGGSRYFIRALGDIAVTEGLAGSEISLYDIDIEKAEIMAQHGTRLAEESGLGMTVRVAKGLADAVDSADFAVSSIGGAGASVGGIYGTEAHIFDILIPARYGIFQVVGDTGGPAGMMMGLRSIPIYIDHLPRDGEALSRCYPHESLESDGPSLSRDREVHEYQSYWCLSRCTGGNHANRPASRCRTA
jgi:alpha-galactosidase